ncbi:DUF2147 domain-containing protein [Tsuneonella mangrovi]|uniref:DUF2147 domain-containing protein n=1 Tax=Tsuneonella mangrovi TaxID=1982042 RepID=UPI000BA203E0|nr:DUF2147 domain-containing protein [Tsuneonella mangrovi]
MKAMHRIAMGLVLAGIAATPALARDPSGTYKRPNGDIVKVWVNENKLYCKIEKGKKVGFEMCHGMGPQGEDWFGKHMKHPGMPGFMTFNGTVTSNDTSMKIKGCAMGKAFCDSEIWTKLPPPEAKPSEAPKPAEAAKPAEPKS